MRELECLNGEFAVYPGHPVVLGYILTNAYPSLAEALMPTEVNRHDALGNSNVPGAGGNVYMALDLLRNIVTGTLPIDRALEDADQRWADCDNQAKVDPDRWREGQEQADRFKAALKAQLETWK